MLRQTITSYHFNFN